MTASSIYWIIISNHTGGIQCITTSSIKCHETITTAVITITTISKITLVTVATTIPKITLITAPTTVSTTAATVTRIIPKTAALKALTLCTTAAYQT